MRISQTLMEHTLHKQHVLNSIKEELEQYMSDEIDMAVVTLKEWLDETTWESKEIRKDSIRQHDIRALVIKIFSNIIMSCAKPMPLVSIASMATLTDSLDKIDNIHLTCEVIAVLKDSGIYAIENTPDNTRIVVSQVEPSESLARKIYIGCYLPPMIQKPQTLYSNTDSAFLTIKSDKVILGGKLNQHNACISLDVLNTLNSNEYELDEEAIKVVKPFHREELSVDEFKKLDVYEQQQYTQEYDNYVKYLEQINYLKELLKGQKIYFTHKPDKRGRIYTQGYHFNTQGSEYEKSCLNLYKKEVVHGTL